MYIANFNRAPDDAGLKYWIDSSKLFLEEIASSFYDQEETKKIYPHTLTNEEFIDAVYDNMFNRKPDDKGFKYWQKVLNDGLISRSLFILAVGNGAQSNDKLILNNKTIVGLKFADAGNNEIADAYDIMENVTEDIKSVDSALCKYNLDGCDGQESVPVLDNFIGSIMETAEGWARVGTIHIQSTGNKPISKIVLSENGYKNFEVNTKGDIIVSLRADLNATTNPLYTLKAVATNDLGDSNSVNVNINVIAIDGDNNTPILESSNGTVLENALVGDSVGAVTIKSSGSSDILTITLSGDGYKNFKVDNRGYVTVASGASFDYDTTRSYNLKVIAKNSSGNSNIADFKISVTKQGVEGSPILQPSIGTVSEDAKAGSRVGSIIVKSSGTSTITSIVLSGSGSSNFTVDKTTKIISVASGAEFNYDTTPLYSLKAVANNSIGASNTVAVTINVTKVGSSDVPILAPSTGTVPENATEGTAVGKVTITSSGGSPIIRIYLSNFDKDSFTIDKDGNIQVSAYSHLDYEKYQSYSLTATAINNQGESTPVSVVISVTDIAENNPILENSSGSISENAEANTTVGVVKVKSSGDGTITAMTLDGIGEAKFLIDAKGKVTLKDSHSLDYEEVAEYNLTVIASSEVGHSDSVKFYIEVTNFSDVKPTIQAFTGSIDENASIGDLVGTINIIEEGDSSITEITLGDDTTSSFIVNTSGNITVAKRLDFETIANYILSAIATNDAGNSDSVAINIKVKDIIEIAPILGDTIGSVPENGEAGKKVADINITNDGGEDIISVTLSGIGNENFLVSLDGNITLANDAILSYTYNPEYNLTAIVSNKIGDSNIGNVHISVTREASLYPVLSPLFISILETMKFEEKVGDINITSEGTSDILDITLSGIGSEDFEVNREGVIRVSTFYGLDYDTQSIYTLKSVARNHSGNSNKVDVNITLIKVDKQLPTLMDTVLSIDENTTSNTIIGEIPILDIGDSPIISFEINGSNHDQFNINDSGSISVSNEATLDYDYGIRMFNLSVMAQNNSGYSDEVNLTIYINDVPDLNAILKDFSVDVEENATSSMSLGQISITQGDSNITAINLTGEGEGNFTVNNSGII
ncbi:MAG: cadherin domain-containing protein, partial [Sulfurovum sp.]|nr:cadherin domain-containing protein [Sulfurovaceae bacterium]